MKCCQICPNLYSVLSTHELTSPCRPLAPIWKLGLFDYSQIGYVWTTPCSHPQFPPWHTPFAAQTPRRVHAFLPYPCYGTGNCPSAILLHKLPQDLCSYPGTPGRHAGNLREPTAASLAVQHGVSIATWCALRRYLYSPNGTSTLQGLIRLLLAVDGLPAPAAQPHIAEKPSRMTTSVLASPRRVSYIRKIKRPTAVNPQASRIRSWRTRKQQHSLDNSRLRCQALLHRPVKADRPRNSATFQTP